MAAEAEAEVERELIRERTDGGRIAAMASGVKLGRKPHSQSAKVQELIAQDTPEKTVLEKTGISRATFCRLNKGTRAGLPLVTREKTKR